MTMLVVTITPETILKKAVITAISDAMTIIRWPLPVKVGEEAVHPHEPIVLALSEREENEGEGERTRERGESGRGGERGEKR